MSMQVKEFVPNKSALGEGYTIKYTGVHEPPLVPSPNALEWDTIFLGVEPRSRRSLTWIAYDRRYEAESLNPARRSTGQRVDPSYDDVMELYEEEATVDPEIRIFYGESTTVILRKRNTT